jgi:hypothetical protein
VQAPFFWVCLASKQTTTAPLQKKSCLFLLLLKKKKMTSYSPIPDYHLELQCGPCGKIRVKGYVLAEVGAKVELVATKAGSTTDPQNPVELIGALVDQGFGKFNKCVDAICTPCDDCCYYFLKTTLQDVVHVSKLYRKPDCKKSSSKDCSCKCK